MLVRVSLFIFLFSPLYGLAQEIIFTRKNGEERKFSIAELSAKVKTERVRIFNFKSRVFEEYEAFSVRELLPFISGQLGIPSNLSLQTRNGYAPVVKREHLLREPGYFAFKRINGKMNTISHTTGDLVETSPLYLVWAGQKERDRNKGLRWVYQIEGMTYNTSASLVEKLPENVPTSVSEGARLYQSHCLRCHQQGGVAAEILSPSVFYRQKAEWIARYIVDAKSINPKSRMPVFKQVFQSEGDVALILNYMKYVQDPKVFEQKQESINDELNRALNQAR